MNQSVLIVHDKLTNFNIKIGAATFHDLIVVGSNKNIKFTVSNNVLLE